jgi:ferredoxin-NADP reductase
VQLRRTLWRLAEVIEVVPETPRTKSLLLEVPEWEGHKAGQHVDVRLTAEDGYQTQRSYSIASAPEDERLMLTVDRLDDGEVSIYLTDVLMAGDKLEFRGPIGGYFTWELQDGGPLFLVGGGSGVVPLMAMIRHRAAAGSDVPSRLLYSSRSYEEIIFREELENFAARDGSLEVIHTLTRSRPEGWTGYDRRIDAEMLREVAWSPDESPLAFVCGSTSFVEGVADALVSLGHDPAREDRTLRTHWRLESYGRAQAGRQRCSWHPRGGLLLRGNYRVLRLRGLRKGRSDRGGDGLRGEGAWHHRPLPELRQCPHPTRSQPRAALDRSEGHKIPAGRGRRRVKRIGDIRAR